MNNVYVLGNGQLGRMLRQAGEPLGINVYPIGIEAQPDDLVWQNAVITAEIERWPDTPLTQKLAADPHFINRDIFSVLADRFSQKQLLDKLQLATSPWQLLSQQFDQPLLDRHQQWQKIFTDIGQQVVVKRRTGGYDGRGQWRITANQYQTLPEDVYGQAIVEQAIDFDREMSLVGARNQQGQCVFYPLTHNLHQEGILRASVAFASPPPSLQHQAEQMLSRIMHELDYVGVMAMECFVMGDQLLINELAPRVHNSGHWTQNGASISQFELHLRAILNLPMPKPVIDGSSVMINLIGIAINPQWLSLPLLHLHWYDKEIRTGRKLGHLNLTHSKPAELMGTLQQLQPLIHDDYQDCLAWAQTVLDQ